MRLPYLQAQVLETNAVWVRGKSSHALLNNFSNFFFFKTIAILKTFIDHTIRFSKQYEKGNTVKVRKTLVFPHFPESNSKPIFSLRFSACRRVARIWKRGGLFWKSEKCANDVDSNFHWPWISFRWFVRNLRRNVSERSEIQRFFPLKIRWSPKKKKKKKKKVFAKIRSDFSAEIRNSNVFSAQNQVISKKKKKKKKGFRQNSEWFFGRNPKFNRFFRPKLGDLQKKKKKKVFAKIQSDFSAEIQTSNVFSAQNQVISKKKKKKKVFAKIHGDFSPNFATSNVWGGAIFEWGGLFSIFHRKSASKAQKTCVFAYFTSQWGGLEPPPAPPPGYATECMWCFSIVLHLMPMNEWAHRFGRQKIL